MESFKVKNPVLLAVSSTGEKLKLLLIFKFKMPFCFGKKNIEDFPTYYFDNKKSWINSENFWIWISILNKEIKKQNRKILLFQDNAPVHSKNISLTNLKLFFFPSNSTSKIQTLDQGIIKAFKDSYKKVLNADIHNSIYTSSSKSFESYLKNITVLDAIF
ncbi:Tigger transposable element-derived protein 4 [Dictyocoela muelleri]|nr:Tigger transposable element-derived protein 4 [Dictyocoela muelleri]